MTLLDEIEPTWDVRERHSTLVRAEPSRVWQSLHELQVGASKVLLVLMAIRALPVALLRGFPRVQLSRPLLAEATERGFAALAECPGEELVYGIVARFWTLEDRAPVRLRGREDFASHCQPGVARASINFRLERVDSGLTRLSTETRVRAFGRAKLLFGIYWALIRPGSAWIRRDWLRQIRRHAEAASRAPTL